MGCRQGVWESSVLLMTFASYLLIALGVIVSLSYFVSHGHLNSCRFCHITPFLSPKRTMAMLPHVPQLHPSCRVQVFHSAPNLILSTKTFPDTVFQILETQPTAMQMLRLLSSRVTRILTVQSKASGILRTDSISGTSTRMFSWTRCHSQMNSKSTF